MRPVILGLDPGFASFGWALMRLGPTREEDAVTDVGVWRTAKADKKRRVRDTDDNVERARGLSRLLADLVQKRGHHLTAVAIEQVSFVRSASTMAKIGMAHGLTIYAVEALGLPMMGCTPQELKLAVCGRRDASKDEIRNALRTRYLVAGAEHGALAVLDDEVPRGQQEHPYDALGAIVACLESEPIRMARRLAA